MTRDHYVILGVPRDASAEQIKAARRARLREAHPDANPGDPGAAERFDSICKVCEVLGDPERRRMYDRTLDGRTDTVPGGRVRCGACSGSGAWGFLVCGHCEGLGRRGMGFSTECPECEGSGRVPDPCYKCDGRGWRSTAAPPKQEKPKPPPPPRKAVQTCYEVLGVDPGASAAQISERYRSIVRTEGRPVPEKVKAAFRRVGDPRRRAGYNRGLGLPVDGPSSDIDVHVSRRAATQGATSYAFTVSDRDLCPHCDGVGRIMLPCGTCEGRGYWRWAGTTKCDACNGRGTDERACFQCALSGWVDTTRTLTGPIPAASGENTRVTVRDDLLGVVTLRLRLALVPGSAREET